MIVNDNWGATITINNKTYSLYNSYNKSDLNYNYLYEHNVRGILYDHLKELLKTMNVNDYLTIYMFRSTSWGMTVTRCENDYEINYYKSYEGPW